MPNYNGLLLSNCYVHMFKSILMLGNDRKLTQEYIKISLFSVMVGGMLLFWLWEAMLITYFAFASKILPFNNIKEFVENTDLKVIAVESILLNRIFNSLLFSIF